MQSANDPNVDYKALVRRGFDRCAASYEEARQAEAKPLLAWLIARLPHGACVLDIGCGALIPIARTLARATRLHNLVQRYRPFK